MGKRMNTFTASLNETADLVREGWELLVQPLGLPKAIQFVVLLERGKGDSVAEIQEYWGEASIDEIHARIMQWKEQHA